MKLSVIILSYNTKDLLKNCLESIRKYTYGLEFEIIVVDNGSKDESVEEVKKFKMQNLKLKIIENKTNLGFAGGNNVGIRKALGEYILLLNSDTFLKDNALLKMVKFLDSRPDISVLGPRLLNQDGSFQASVGRFPTLPVVFWMLFKEHFGGSEYVRLSPKEESEVDWLMGAALMARKNIFKKAGLLDENIFMYMEEVEWCYRVKKAGFKIYFYPEAEIIHLWQGSSRTGRKDPILNIYRGLIYFYRKHKNPAELSLLRLLLKLKALGALGLGYIENNQYLKETYGEAFKLA